MNPIEQLRDHIHHKYPSAVLRLTRPLGDHGAWSLDIDIGAKSLSISWSHAGFGLSMPTPEGYGEGPDETEHSLAKIQRRIDALLTGTERTAPFFGVLLSRVRGERGITQRELATRLGVSQSTLSGIEKRSDLQVSTLRRVVEALGGALEIFAVFSNDRYRVDLGGARSTARPSRVTQSKSAIADEAFEQLQRTGALPRATAVANDICCRGSVLEMV
jgi:transcriptional regulator with XRE-family HTH domain